jgi:hypothetical protein
MDNVTGSNLPNSSSTMVQYERQIADAWAKITIKRWQKKIQGLKIGESGELTRSFLFDVVASARGDVLKIDFAFKYYGKFVDMGVGKGVKIGQVKENQDSRKLEGKMLGNRRRPKKWYSKTFAAEAMKLGEIMAKEFGRRGTVVISENINDRSIK